MKSNRARHWRHSPQRAAQACGSSVTVSPKGVAYLRVGAVEEVFTDVVAGEAQGLNFVVDVLRARDFFA